MFYAEFLQYFSSLNLPGGDQLIVPILSRYVICGVCIYVVIWLQCTLKPSLCNIITGKLAHAFNGTKLCSLLWSRFLLIFMLICVHSGPKQPEGVCYTSVMAKSWSRNQHSTDSTVYRTGGWTTPSKVSGRTFLLPPFNYFTGSPHLRHWSDLCPPIPMPWTEHSGVLQASLNNEKESSKKCTPFDIL